MGNLFWIGLVGAFIALCFAFIQSRSVFKFDEGTDKMKQISMAIRKGAGAYLKRQYKTVAIIFIFIAVILALLERAGEPQLGVARTCVLAREMIEIVRGYNQKSQEAGLPTLELGIGICYQDSAPMYLVDGSQQIMISPALNESDRLSSCSRAARRVFRDVESLFNVYCVQTVDDADAAGEPDEFLLRYNIGGISLNEAAFRKLQQEISLEQHELNLPSLWDEQTVRLYSGVVPVGPGTFHNIVIREAMVPQVEPREFRLKKWSASKYYEVCTNEAIYEYVIQQSRSAGA
jgi:preprotein translocase subunit SecG